MRLYNLLKIMDEDEMDMFLRDYINDPSQIKIRAKDCLDPDVWDMIAKKYLKGYEKFSETFICSFAEDEGYGNFTKGNVYRISDNVLYDDSGIQYFIRNPNEETLYEVIGDSSFDIISGFKECDFDDMFNGWVYCKRWFEADPYTRHDFISGKAYQVYCGYICSEDDERYGPFQTYEDFVAYFEKDGCWINMHYGED